MREDGSGRVSVVIPTRNRVDLLRETLRSVLAQSTPPAEIIVADDGSTDGTEALVHELGLTYLSNPGGGWGAAGARNAGLERVRTEYVAFVDSDDLLLPGAFEILRAALERAQGAPFAYGRGLAAFRDGDGWRPDGLISVRDAELDDLRRAIFIRNSVPSSGALVRTEAAVAVGGYNAAMVFVEDHDFWIRLAKLGQPVHVPQLTSIHRRHEGNRHTPAVASSDMETVVRLAEDDPRLQPAVPERIGVELCEVVVSSIKSRSSTPLTPVARLLAGRRDKLVTLRRSCLHWRARRAWRRDGTRLWRDHPEVREWLSAY